MPKFKVCKTDTCLSLNGNSTITYDIGLNAERQIGVRIIGNSESGKFDKKWFPVEKLCSIIEKHIEEKENRFASTVWKIEIFKNKNNNTSGFLMAVLQANGMVEELEKIGVRLFQRRTDKKVSSLMKELDCTEK